MIIKQDLGNSFIAKYTLTALKKGQTSIVDDLGLCLICSSI